MGSISKPFGIPPVPSAVSGNLARFAAGGVLADSGAPAVNVSRSAVRVFASAAGCVPDCVVATGAKIGGGTPTDNAAALNAILATATATNPVELILDGGFAIGKSLLIPAAGNVTIRGMGWGTGLFVLSGSNTNAISSAVFGTTDESYWQVWGAGVNTGLAGPSALTGQTGSNVAIRDLFINGNRGTYPTGNCNGTRDGTITGQTSPAANAQSPYPNLYWLTGIALAQLDNVLIDNVHVYDSPAYQTVFWACTHVRVNRCRLEAPGRQGSTDGVHINGGCSDVIIDGCTLAVGDDGVAFNIEEGNQVAGSDYKAVNLTFENCSSGVRVYGSTATQTYRVTIAHCTGTIASNLFLIISGTTPGGTLTGLNHSITLSDIEVQFVNSAYGLVGLGADVGSLVLDNVRTIDPLFPLPLVYVLGNPTVTDLVIHNCHIQRTQAGNAAAFFLYAPAGTIHNLEVSDCTLTQQVGFTYADVNYAVDMYAGTGTAVATNINFSNCVFDGVYHAYIVMTGGNVTANGVVYTTRTPGTACFNLYSGAFTLSATNVVMNGVQTLYSTQTGTVTIGGTIAVGSLSLPALPTSDPHVAGQVWSNSHVLTVSAG